MKAVMLTGNGLENVYAYAGQKDTPKKHSKTGQGYSSNKKPEPQKRCGRCHHQRNDKERPRWQRADIGLRLETYLCIEYRGGA